jgi:hypothetical protein
MARPDLTVRGAGIFGLSIAWEAARRGARVRVIEVVRIGAGSSGGLVGALAGPALFDRLGIRRPEVRGFALGTAAHGIGAARAWQVHPAAGAYAALALAGTSMARPPSSTKPVDSPNKAVCADSRAAAAACAVPNMASASR